MKTKGYLVKSPTNHGRPKFYKSLKVAQYYLKTTHPNWIIYEVEQIVKDNGIITYEFITHNPINQN